MRCVKCGCTDTEYLKRLPDQKICGATADGRVYNAIVRVRRVCRDCGQVLIARAYARKLTPNQIQS